MGAELPIRQWRVMKLPRDKRGVLVYVDPATEVVRLFERDLDEEPEGSPEGNPGEGGSAAEVPSGSEADQEALPF